MAKIICATFAEELRVGWEHLCFALLIIGAVQNKHFCFLYRFLEPYNNGMAVAVQKAHREKNRKTMLGGNGWRELEEKRPIVTFEHFLHKKSCQRIFSRWSACQQDQKTTNQTAGRGKNPGVYEKVNFTQRNIFPSSHELTGASQREASTCKNS